MPNHKIAICVFSKTPGLGAIKTRLAKKIGRDKAEEFFKLSLDCIRYTLNTVKLHYQCEIFFAVAEEEACDHPFWANDQCFFQGHGDLGNRLSYVHKKLISDFGRVIIIGGDSPTLELLHFENAIDSLAHNDIGIGPSIDGGFYLISSKVPIPKSVWQKTPYSCSETFEILKKELEVISGPIVYEPLLDVDHYGDLLSLLNSLSKKRLNFPQEKLFDYVKSIIYV